MREIDLLSRIGKVDLIAVPATGQFREILEIPRDLWLTELAIHSLLYETVHGVNQLVLVVNPKLFQLAAIRLFKEILKLANTQPKQTVLLYYHDSYMHFESVLPRCVEVVSLPKEKPSQLTFIS